jgi:hypothetical protein
MFPEKKADEWLLSFEKYSYNRLLETENQLELFSFVLVLRSGDTEEVSVMLFAYVGPETMLPLASVLAGAVGLLLMFGRNVMMFGRKIVRGVRGLTGRR